MPNRTIAKTLKPDWAFVTGEDDADEVICLTLTKGQARTLQAIVDYQRWPTRWENAPPAEDLNDYVDALESALMGEVCNVPITDMRVTDCTLEVQYDGAPAWVPIGMFFPLDATCTITGAVEIEHGESAVATVINALNTRNNPAEASGLAWLMRGYDFSGAIKTLASIESTWIDKSLDRTVLDFRLYGEGNSDVLFRAQTRVAMTIYGDDAFLRNGLSIRPKNQAYTSGLLNLYVYNHNQNRFMFQQLPSGQVTLTRHNNGASLASNALLIQAFNDTVTPGVGFGSSIRFQAKSSTTEGREQARIVSSWLSATDSSRQGQMRLAVSDYLGEVDVLKMTAHDGESAIAVHGNEPITKPTLGGSTEYAALTGLISILEDYGWLDDGTSVTPDGNSLPGAQGDPNLPPDDIPDYCNAAGYLINIIIGHMVTAHEDAEFDAFNVYNDFKERHGYNLEVLWDAALLFETQYIAVWDDDVFPELDANQHIMQVVLAIDPYSRADFLAWAFGFFPTEAYEALSAWLLVYTEAKWKELVYTGYRYNQPFFGCEICDGPAEGNDWAIEWTGSGLAEDWLVNGCGDGLSFEINCGGTAARLQIRFQIPSPSSTLFDFTLCQVDIAYTLEDDHEITGGVTGQAGAGATFPAEDALTGSGTVTMSVSGMDVQSFTSNYVNISLACDFPFPGAGESLTVTRIRLEGTGTQPDSNGVGCE